LATFACDNAVQHLQTAVDLLREGGGQSTESSATLSSVLVRLGEAGALEREQRGWHLAEGAEALFRLSPELRTSLWLRLQPLSAACRGLLETAAVLGRRFDPQIAASTHGLSEQQALPLLDEALGQAVLQSRNRQLEFSHDLLRAALDEAINPLRRRQLHDRAAEALRQHGAGQRAPAALAFHLLRGSQPEQAVPVLLKAGERALSTFAFDNAVEHLQTAADLLREGAEDSQTGDVAGGVGLPGVLVRLGEALMGAGRYDAALEVYDEALRSAAGDRELIGRLYARIGDIHLAREETERAIAAHRSSLACFGQADHPDAARALLQLAELRLVALSEHAEGASLARRALRMARGLGSAELEAEALGAIGTAEVRMGRPAGVGTLGQALSAAERLGSPTLIGRIANRLAQHHYWAAELSESGAAAQRAVAGLRGVADPRLLGWPTFWLGLVAFTRGEWESARRRAAELLQLGEQLGVRRFQAQGLQIQGMVAQDLGQLDEAVVLLGQAADLFRAIAPGTLVFYLGRSCLALLQAGRQAAGERVLAELETLVESLPPTAKPRLSGLNLVGLAYLELGRADADQRIERGLLPARDQLHWSLAARTLGELALARGGSDAASEMLGHARELALRSNARPELARIERSLRRLEGLSQSGRSALGLRAPDRLTRREREVLRLMAEGCTNRQIAERLIITEHTVLNHVTHILDKLAATNRAGAVAQALRSGLISPGPAA
jgi:DNA-binding CsgD family transcriptional regulator/predicted negative regulator of RcsB-dependent stress response